MGDRQPVSKAEEFTNAFVAYNKARLQAFKTNSKHDLEEFHERRKDLIDVMDFNQDLIARALRRDDIISVDALDSVSRNTGYATYVVKQIIDAFREVVQ